MAGGPKSKLDLLLNFDTLPHGTLSTYRDWGCRCFDCLARHVEPAGTKSDKALESMADWLSASDQGSRSLPWDHVYQPLPAEPDPEDIYDLEVGPRSFTRRRVDGEWDDPTWFPVEVDEDLLATSELEGLRELWNPDRYTSVGRLRHTSVGRLRRSAICRGVLLRTLSASGPMLTYALTECDVPRVKLHLMGMWREGLVDRTPHQKTSLWAITAAGSATLALTDTEIRFEAAGDDRRELQRECCRLIEELIDLDRDRPSSEQLEVWYRAGRVQEKQRMESERRAAMARNLRAAESERMVCEGMTADRRRTPLTVVRRKRRIILGALEDSWVETREVVARCGEELSDHVVRRHLRSMLEAGLVDCDSGSSGAAWRITMEGAAVLFGEVS